MRIVVLGAGISGLAAAFALKETTGYDCPIYEQEQSAGGLCRTLNRGAFTLDLVSHVLHFRSAAARRLVHEALDGHLIELRRDSAVRFQGRGVPYPFQSHLGFLPTRESIECLGGYAFSWLRRNLESPGNARHFAEWIRTHFGHGIARHFMTPYNTKLWGVPLEELSVDWLRPFVPNTSFREIFGSFLSHRVNGAGYNSVIHYPANGGIQSLIDALTERTACLHTGHRATSIDLKAKRIGFENGSTVSYDRLISTVPLNRLILQARDVPADIQAAAMRLRSTSLRCLTFCVRKPQRHSRHWLYFPERQFPFFRLVFPSNYCPALCPPGCSIISAEISHPDPGHAGDLEQEVMQQLLTLRLIDQSSDVAYVNNSFFPYAYPVHDFHRAASVSRILEYLQAHGVRSIGRFGAWRYSSMDDAIAEADQVAQELAQEARAFCAASSSD